MLIAPAKVAATEAISKAASGKTGELMSDDFSSRKTQALALESLNTAMTERAKQPISGAFPPSPEEIAERIDTTIIQEPFEKDEEMWQKCKHDKLGTILIPEIGRAHV